MVTRTNKKTLHVPKSTPEVLHVAACFLEVHWAPIFAQLSYVVLKRPGVRRTCQEWILCHICNLGLIKEECHPHYRKKNVHTKACPCIKVRKNKLGTP